MKNRILLLLSLAIQLSVTGQTFTDITSQSGINVLPSLGDVAIWIDYNNDGWLDIFGSTQNQTLFYHNNGDGTFSDITEQSGLAATTPHSLAVGDYDNDGYTDILLSSMHSSDPLKVYRNNSGNGFVETFNTGFSTNRGIWMDYDCDGHLDIFCLTWGGTPYLFRNDGNGSFEDVTQNMGFNQSSGTTASASDYNNDGFPDIYCAFSSNTKTNRLYKNIAGMGFEDVTIAAAVSDYRKSVAVAWGDYNDDGLMDLYFANIGSNRNVLFHNNGNGKFTDKTLTAGVGDVGDARTCAWIDYNNDGYLDLFTTNHVNPNRLHENNGDGTFTNVAPAANINGPSDGFTISWGDFDRDGDLDIIFAGHSYGFILLKNDGGNAQNFLNITLEGTFDNRSSIGSRVTVFANDRQQIREINGGRGASSQDALALHIGLGNAQIVDSIHILWPSGMLQKLYNINANQFITIQQEGNVPPRIFRLIEPLPDISDTNRGVVFKWTASYDPDLGNTIDYYLHIENPNQSTVFGPVQDTTINIVPAPWMSADSTYWYVNASDGIDVRRSWEKWEFNYTSTAILGDANCDGIVNVLDVICLANYIAGQNPDPFCFENADISGDGIINLLDIILTVNIIIE